LVELLPSAPLTTVETATPPPYPTVETTALDFGMERSRLERERRL
jgi:hypothetical protein